MQTEIIIAGFGGQGVLFGGILLAQAAVEEGRSTTWFPAYGAEMRGGTANSTVIISDDEIGSPLVARPSGLIALSGQSLAKFFPKVNDGAVVAVNTSLIRETVGRPGIAIAPVPATEIAAQTLGDVRMANLVIVGAYLNASRVLRLESAQKACERVLAEKPKLIAVNQKALELGYRYGSR